MNSLTLSSSRQMLSNSHGNAHHTIAMLKSADADYEWYPTTQEQIDSIKADIHQQFVLSDVDEFCGSVLDIGCGDGRVVSALTGSRYLRYGIEKSTILLAKLDPNIIVLGTDFSQQTLIDKKVDVVFSSPPFGEFASWANRIITESNSSYAYLILPKRWESDIGIAQALDARQAKATVIGTSDFLNADRKARGTVHLIRVEFCRPTFHPQQHKSMRVDPFECWFDRTFDITVNDNSVSDYQRKEAATAKMREQEENSTDLIEEVGLIPALVSQYDAAMNNYIMNYKKLGELDSALLYTLNVNTKNLKSSLKMSIDNLKDIYWQKLFDRLDVLTDRLTSTTRTAFLNKINKRVHVDFTTSNVHTVVQWAIQGANQYYDEQLLSIFDKMTERDNIIAYKSNRRFLDASWKSNNRLSGKFDKYALEYRIVVQGQSGIDGSQDSGLSKSATVFLNDIRTVANNLYYDCMSHDGPDDFEWVSRKENELLFTHHTNGQTRTLMAVKAFVKGTLHIRFDQSFMTRLNIEAGRLRGWLTSTHEAADELSISLEEATKHFNVNHKVEVNKLDGESAIKALNLVV